MLVRHGDVLVQRVESLPKGCMKRPGLILAHGEATGHSHRIKERGAGCLYGGHDGIYLDVTAEKATLVHQEHKPIELPKGVYRVWRQREYFPGFIRYVGD